MTRREFLPLGGATLLSTMPIGRILAATRTEVENEMQRRAEGYLTQKYLSVDYYRIRYKLAYPLPVASLSLPQLAITGLGDYPWATWMLWELEQRVNSLGWATEWSSRSDCKTAATRDLEALCAWPKYCQYRQPDLSSGHAGRLLWSSFTRWQWPNGALRRKIAAACVRHVEEVLPLAEAHFGPRRSKAYLLQLPEPYKKLPNIPVIGTIAAALTAHVAGHAAATRLDSMVRAAFGAILDLRMKGLSEAVCYDGYTLDFLADWLQTQPPDDRNAILNHPALAQFLDESYMLSAPGAAEQLAELSDVEPIEMPFHFSAHAKLMRWQPSPTRQWLMRQWPVKRIRSDGLGILAGIAGQLHGVTPPAGALNAHYAVVLRTGWDSDDLAAAMSCTNSPMSHVQNDNGTLVIGTRRRWIIADPGYQQYMEGAERDFTLGPAAHKYPVINGLPQTSKQPRLITLRAEHGLLRTTVELAGCYPPEIHAKSIVRNVWLKPRNLVVVADQIDATDARTLYYHWHGHPETAWNSQESWMLLHLPDVDLWFTSPQVPLSMTNIARHPGSRGQLTAQVEITPVPTVFWWIFVLGSARPDYQLANGDRALQIAGVEFII